EPLKVHFGGKEQFVKRVRVKQPRSRRNIDHELLVQDRALMSGKGAAGSLELLHKASDRSRVEDTHTLIVEVKERACRRLRGDKIVTPCRRQHIPIRRGGRTAGLIVHGVQQRKLSQGYLLVVVWLSGAPCLEVLQHARWLLR